MQTSATKEERRRREGSEWKGSGAHLLAHFRLDLEQVHFETLLHLACLLLGCCFFRTEIGDLFRQQQGLHSEHRHEQFPKHMRSWRIQGALYFPGAGWLLGHQQGVMLSSPDLGVTQLPAGLHASSTTLAARLVIAFVTLLLPLAGGSLTQNLSLALQEEGYRASKTVKANARSRLLICWHPQEV